MSDPSVTTLRLSRWFILAAAVFLVIGTLEGFLFPTKVMWSRFYSALFAVPQDQVRPFFVDFFSRVHTHITLVGWVSSALIGILYYLAPRLGGKDQPVIWLGRLGFWLHVAGLLILCLGWHVVGSAGLSAGFAHGTREFSAVVKPFKFLIFTGAGALCLAAIIFTINMFRLLKPAAARH